MSIAQLNSSGLGEFWVKPQNLDGERHFVGDALAGGLPAGPKLKIGRMVVVAVAILVVNILTFHQIASKNSLHNGSMDVILSTTASPNAESSIPAVGAMAGFVKERPHAPVVAALSGAEFLAHVVAGHSAAFHPHGTALFNLTAMRATERRWGIFVHAGQYTAFDEPAMEAA